MSMLRIAGKTKDNKAVGVACEDNGQVKTSREWKQNVVTLMNGQELRSNSVITIINDDSFDASPYAFTTLRIHNELDANIKINFYDDLTKPTTGWLKNASGSYVEITIGKGLFIVTPDDVPFLKYCNLLKLRIEPLSVPTTGKLTIHAVGKA